MKAALESRTLPKDLLICGPAGTGKTFGILTVLHLLAADYDGLRILIVRKTRSSLTESALVTYEEEILPADGMEFIARGASRSHRHAYVYPSRSIIVPAGLDNPTRITSSAWDIVYANESIELTEDGWETCGSRVDRPGRDPRFGLMMGDTNPGDPAHWLLKRCQAGRTALWDTTHAANPALHDGRAWTPDGIRYRARLDRLKGARRRRYFEGLWSAAEGQWFEGFDSDRHVTEAAEFDPRYPVHLAVDTGVHTGAVLFQIREPKAPGDDPRITVFGDYYAFNVAAYDAALAIRDLVGRLCGGRIDKGSTDPAGDSATSFGITVLQEYERARLKLTPWPIGPVADGLALIDSFLMADSTPPGLAVHPRCVSLIDAFANYKRAMRRGQWTDKHEDPQHPYEDVMDALRGGLKAAYPEGRRKPLTFRKAPVFRAIY